MHPDYADHAGWWARINEAGVQFDGAGLLRDS
jgi:hypothetical protein